MCENTLGIHRRTQTIGCCVARWGVFYHPHNWSESITSCLWIWQLPKPLRKKKKKVLLFLQSQGVWSVGWRGSSEQWTRVAMSTPWARGGQWGSLSHHPLKHPSQSQPKKHAGEGTSSKGFLPGAEIQPREGVLLYPVRRFVVWSGDLGEVTSPFGVSVC